MFEGRWIVVEGIDGVGKSTLVKYLHRILLERGEPVLVTREPGGSPLGEFLRTWFLGRQEISIPTELLLLFAARIDHLEQVIYPALRAGKWVLCDRFIDSTYAYQGGGRGFPSEHISWLEKNFLSSRQPDRTLLLDLPVEVALARAKKRGVTDRFEQENVAFYERVRSAYLARASLAPERYQIVEASQPWEEVWVTSFLDFQVNC
ncbi:Thymidylate kinase [Gammaproteobacteria bacterium]